MAQVIRKWIADQAVNNQKIDPTDIYYMGGIVVDNTGNFGTIGIGTNVVPALDGMTIYRDNSPALNLFSGTGRTYQLKSDGGSNFRIYDVDEGLNRLSINASGFTGFGSDDAVSLVHMRSTVLDTKLTLDMDDGGSGRSYQLLSNTSGEFQIYDLDAATTRFLIDPSGAVTITGDATVDGNFQVDGDVTIINTEIVVTDMLEINQSQNQPALIASQDATNLSVVVSVENAGSGPALTTTGNGISVGIGTATVVAGAALQVEGNIVGKLTASPSNIGSPTRRIGTIYMASTIDHASKVLCVSSGNVTMGLTVSGQLGLGIDPVSADYSIDAYRASDFNLVRVDTGTSTIAERAGYEIWQAGVRKAQMTMGHDLCIMGSEAGVYYTHLRVNGIDGMVMDPSNVILPTLGIIVEDDDITIQNGRIGVGTTPVSSNHPIDSYSPTNTNLIRINTGVTNITEKSGVSMSLDGSVAAELYVGNNLCVMGGVVGTNLTQLNVNGIAGIFMDPSKVTIPTLDMLIAQGDLEVTQGKIGVGTAPSGDNFIDSYTSGDINKIRIHSGSSSSTAEVGIDLWGNSSQLGFLNVDNNGYFSLGTATGSSTLYFYVNGVNEMRLLTTELFLPNVDIRLASGKIGVGTAPSGDNFIDSYTSGDTNKIRIHSGSSSSTAEVGIDLWGNFSQLGFLNVDNNGYFSLGTATGSSTLYFFVNGVNEMRLLTTELFLPNADIRLASGKIGVGTAPSGDNFIDSYTSGDINKTRIHSGSSSSTAEAGLDLWVNFSSAAFLNVDGNGYCNIGTAAGSSDVIFFVNNSMEMRLTSTELNLINNNLVVGGTITESSDERLKENVVLIDNALDSIAELEGVRFTWKEKNDGVQLGMIAQKVEKVFPEIVLEDSKGYKTISYGKLVSVLVEAVKEEKQKRERLEDRILAIENKLASLK